MRTYVNLLIVFIATGLGHGAAWTFVVWGLYHGFFIVLERVVLGRRARRLESPVWRFAYLLPVVVVGWIVFRASDFEQAAAFVSALVHPLGGSAFELADAVWASLTPASIAATLVGCLVFFRIDGNSLGVWLEGHTSRGGRYAFVGLTRPCRSWSARSRPWRPASVRSCISSFDRVAMRYFLTGFFLLWMALPIGALAVLPHNDRLGSTRVGAISPVLDRLFSGKPGDLTDLTSSIIERSKATSSAISIKNAFHLRWLGHIDTKKLVSGKDGWLYYKPQFYASGCDPKNRWTYRDAANSAALTQAFAAVVGIDLLYTISPDKARIHPEGIDHSVRAYIGCHEENERIYLEVLASLLPEYLDHGQAMLPRMRGGPDMYFHKDTHWNLIGYTLAMRQLREYFGGGRALPNVEVDPSESETRLMGPPKTMLLLDVDETGPVPDRRSRETFLETPIEGLGDVLVIHDSFYAYHRYTQAIMGPDARVVREFTTTGDPVAIKAILSRPDRIIFNSVERSSMDRFRAEWGARGGYMKALLQLDAELARKACAPGMRKPLDKSEWHLERIGENAGRYVSEASNPWMVLPMPQSTGARCFHLEIDMSEPTQMRMHFPPLPGQKSSNRWDFGRYLTLPLKRGKNTVDLVLPPTAADRFLRITPANKRGTTFSVDALSIVPVDEATLEANR